MTQQLADSRDVAVVKLSAVQQVQCSWNDLDSQIHRMPALSALRSLTEASRDLLIRTAELPDTEQGLLVALTEYRHVVCAFAAAADRF